MNVKMIAFAGFAAVSLLTAQSAFAAQEAHCRASWDAFDINKDGTLTGDEALKFYDDMRKDGVMLSTPRGAPITAGQYHRACLNDAWAKWDK